MGLDPENKIRIMTQGVLAAIALSCDAQVMEQIP